MPQVPRASGVLGGRALRNRPARNFIFHGCPNMDLTLGTIITLHSAIMISNQQIVEIAKHALAKVFKTWLDENKAEIVKIVAASIPVPAKLQRQAEPAPKPSPTPALAPEEYLTPQELAKRWNLCVASVYRRLRRDEIPLMRISQRHILVPIAAVKKYEALATYPKLR